MLDADQHAAFTNGLGNELSGTTILDWPGRPGTKVPDHSTSLSKACRTVFYQIQSRQSAEHLIYERFIQ